jgi:RHS repeat-associated protein
MCPISADVKHRNHLNQVIATEYALGYDNLTLLQQAWHSLQAFGSGGDDQFQGHKDDSESGLHYNLARYYDPKISRWAAADSVTTPVYDPQSLNKYAYVRNDPVNLVDPDGNQYGAGGESPSYCDIYGAVDPHCWPFYNPWGIPTDPTPFAASRAYGPPWGGASSYTGVSTSKFEYSQRYFDSIKIRAQRSDCAEFLKDLFGKISTQGEELYNGLISNLAKGPFGGAVIIEDKKYYDDTELGKRTPATTGFNAVDPTKAMYPITLWKPFFGLSADEQLLAVLHEEVHVAGFRVSDIKIAEKYGWIYDNSKTQDENIYDASGFWHQKLVSACK